MLPRQPKQKSTPLDFSNNKTPVFQSIQPSHNEKIPTAGQSGLFSNNISLNQKLIVEDGAVIKNEIVINGIRSTK